MTRPKVRIGVSDAFSRHFSWVIYERYLVLGFIPWWKEVYRVIESTHEHDLGLSRVTEKARSIGEIIK